MQHLPPFRYTNHPKKEKKTKELCVRSIENRLIRQIKQIRNVDYKRCSA